MDCPICKKPVPLKGNPHRPFCSKRCRLLDLESWLHERYRIPIESHASDERLDIDEELNTRSDAD